MYETTHEVFEGRGLAELREPVVNGLGAAGLSELAGSYRSFAAALDEVGGYVESAMQNGRASHSGAAADATQGGLSPLAAFATAASQQASQAEQSVYDVAEHYSTARNSMPAGMDEPSLWTAAANVVAPVSMANPDSNYFVQRAQYDGRADAAAEVMTTYQGNANGTVTALQTFPAPEGSAVGLAAPGGNQVAAGSGTAGGTAGGSSIGGAGSGGAGTGAGSADAGGMGAVSPVGSAGAGAPTGAGTGVQPHAPAATTPAHAGPAETPGQGAGTAGSQARPGLASAGGAPALGTLGVGGIGAAASQGGRAAGDSGRYGSGASGRYGSGGAGGRFTVGGTDGSGPRGSGGSGSGSGPGSGSARGGFGPAGGAGPGVSGTAPGPAGARGGVGAVPMGAGAGRGQGGEDAEHQRPGYLIELDENAIVGKLDRVAPPVIGEDPDVDQSGR